MQTTNNDLKNVGDSTPLNPNINYSLVLEGLKNNSILFSDIDEKLMKNKNFIFDAMKINGLFLKHVDDTFKKDKDIVYQAVYNNSISLMYADETLKEDIDFILQNMKNAISCVEYSSPIVKNDMRVGKYAVENFDYGILYLSENLKNNKELAKTSVKKYVNSFNYLSIELQNDKQFVLEIINETSDFPYRLIPAELQLDTEIILQCLLKNPLTFYDVPFTNIKDTLWLLELTDKLEHHNLLYPNPQNKQFFSKCFQEPELKLILEKNYPNSTFETLFTTTPSFLNESFLFLNKDRMYQNISTQPKSNKKSSLLKF